MQLQVLIFVFSLLFCSLVDAEVERLCFSVIYEKTLVFFFSKINIRVLFMIRRNAEHLFIGDGDDGELPADPYRGESFSVLLAKFLIRKGQEHALVVQHAIYSEAAAQVFIPGAHGEETSGL